MSNHHVKSETARAPGISRTQVERMNKIIQTEILEAGQDPDFDLDEEEIEEPAGNLAHSDALAAVVGAAFDASVTKAVRRRLLHGQALAVVVRVPTPAWVGPVAQHFRSQFGTRWQTIYRDGSIRLEHKASIGSEQVAHNLSRGLCVVGVAADVGILPAALVGAADFTITVGAPDGAALRTAIWRFTRRSPGGLADDHVRGLDLHHIVSAFRPGTGAIRIAQRLVSAAAASRVDAPDEERAEPGHRRRVRAGANVGLGLGQRHRCISRKVDRVVAIATRNLLAWRARHGEVALLQIAGRALPGAPGLHQRVRLVRAGRVSS